MTVDHTWLGAPTQGIVGLRRDRALRRCLGGGWETDVRVHLSQHNRSALTRNRLVLPMRDFACPTTCAIRGAPGLP
jgi:hypothetical protein